MSSTTPDAASEPRSAEAPDATESTEVGRGRPRRLPRPRPVTLVLSAALVAALALAGWLFLDRLEREAVETARREATAQARTAAVALTSYHHESLGKDFGVVKDLAVDPFAGQFEEASATLVEVLETYEGTADGKVVRAAVSSADADRVQVLLFVDQTVKSSLQPKARVDRNRIAMTLVRTDDGWRVSEADLL